MTFSMVNMMTLGVSETLNQGKLTFGAGRYDAVFLKANPAQWIWVDNFGLGKSIVSQISDVPFP